MKVFSSLRFRTRETRDYSMRILKMPKHGGTSIKEGAFGLKDEIENGFKLVRSDSLISFFGLVITREGRVYR